MSIPTESIDGDITADQEHLCPTLMDPSEELQLLRGRIALLERQKTINTAPTSSRASFDLMAQNENGDAADTLCGQNDEIVPINGKEAMADPQQEEEQTKANQTKELVHSLQSNVVGVEDHQHLQKLVAALSERVGIFEAAKCVQSKRVDQMELELMETNKKLEDLERLNAELFAKIDELECKQKADQQNEHRAKIHERQQEGGRGGSQGGDGGFGRHTEGGGLPSNDFSGGGGSGSSGNDGFSNSGFGNFGFRNDDSQSDGNRRLGGDQGPPCSLKVTNLPCNASRQDLSELFYTYGNETIEDVYIPRCNNPNRGYRGYGFVRYNSWSKAEKVLHRVKGLMMNGEQVYVRFAKDRLNDSQSGSNRRSGGGEGRGWLDGREGGRGGGQGGGGGDVGRSNRDTEGGGLPSNEGGGGSGSSGNDGFSNSGLGNSAADDGTHNAPDVIFVDDVIRNKCAPPIGHSAKTELREAELIGIEEDVPSGEPALNSPCAKKVKKEEPN